MYELIYAPSALKALEKLPKTVQERILIALERLRIRPQSYDIKKLVGVVGYRFRVGDYRIIFDLDNNKLFIFILDIGHRRNI